MKKCGDMFLRFDRISACYRQTDGRTDRRTDMLLQQSSRCA